MNDDGHIELLLADPGGRPLLDGGLSADAMGVAPEPVSLPRRIEAGRLAAPDDAPNNLPAQRWGVVAPEGDDGDALLRAIAPLIRVREEEQRAPARVYRVPPAQSADAAVDWMERVYMDEPEAERPAYLLLLGQPLDVSFELGHVLAQRAMVGRLCFDDRGSYAAYAEKAGGWASRRSEEDAPDLLFCVAQDGTRAVADGERLLMRPLLESLDKAKVPAARRERIKSPAELLGAPSGRPSVLVSLANGQGAPAGGWADPAEQRRCQGALSLGGGERFDADALRGARFLPGGAWICIACFGAGTPEVSVFRPWLDQLANLGEVRPDKVAHVMRGLAMERPFVAALPQAALASPDGPLVVIGHVDLSWTYGFASADFTQSRASRILTALRPLARGSRAGTAFNALMDAYRAANNDLAIGYQIQASLPPGVAEEPERRRKRGHTWMLRNDLRGYVLLGDPAARLSLRSASPEADPTPPAVASTTTAPPVASPNVATKEAAVHALLRGDEPPRAIAARVGVSLDVLWGWFDAYRIGGRGKL